MAKELIVLTRSELEEIIEDTVQRTLNQSRPSNKEEKILMGIKEISNYLGISTSTCNRFLSSGVFGDAVFYVGRQVRGYSDRLMESVRQAKR